MRKVVLCGGGSGGHVFPSIAVSEVLKKEGCDLYYIGVFGKPEEKIAEENDIAFYGYEFSGLPRTLQKELITWPFNLLKAVSKAKVYLNHFKPNIVFGTGGYSSAPVFIAAKRLNIPYVVHNPDYRLGMANQFSANGAVLLTLGFESKEIPVKEIETVVTGNPIRKSFLEVDNLDKSRIYEEFNLNSNKKTIFIVGGSQGATAVNEVTLEIIKELVLVNDIQVIHQTGLTYETYLRRVPCKVLESSNYIAKPFFESPEKCYHISDLVISRAGAITTSEISILGKPTIFIPFPFAGNHQEANIMHLINAGGAKLYRQKDLRAKCLLNDIIDLINNKERLDEMSKITKSFAKPNAANDIANLILAKIGNGNGKSQDLISTK